MTIGDLLCNGDFCFNAPFRVYEFLGNYDEDGIPTDEAQLIYEWDGKGSVSDDFLHEHGCEYITAINEGDDGIIEIEYTDMNLYPASWLE